MGTDVPKATSISKIVMNPHDIDMEGIHVWCFLRYPIGGHKHEVPTNRIWGSMGRRRKQLINRVLCKGMRSISDWMGRWGIFFECASWRRIQLKGVVHGFIMSTIVLFKSVVLYIDYSLVLPQLRLVVAYVINVQDWRSHMSFVLKGSWIFGLQFKGWIKSKTSIQEYRNANTKLILSLCINYMIHVSSTMWRFKNQPSNSTSCSDRALGLVLLVAGILYWGL